MVKNQGLNLVGADTTKLRPGNAQMKDWGFDLGPVHVGQGGISVNGNPVNGMGTSGTLNALANDKANQDAARTSLYNEILSGSSVDDLSKNELLGMYTSGASTDQIAAKLAAARAGKGIYAARIVDQSERNTNADMPGRAQLTVGSVRSLV